MNGELLPEGAFKRWLNHEGGESSDRTDTASRGTTGVHTKYGITWRLYKRYYEGPVSKCTRHDARYILYHEFWKRLRMDDWPKEISFSVFDMEGNGGPGKGIKALQRAMNDLNRDDGNELTVDGQLGPKTRRCFSGLRRYWRSVAGNLDVERGLYYRRLRQYKTVKAFRLSWTRRLNRG